ncbi:MAG: cell division protein FtsL [Rhodobiaceae bacterium]|nr:cell division protein FtsL [Rhodobiaceae bacterium]MCC0055668.1 cell division protein FtsL [Rhodobiaceae bacterium]
MRRLATLFLLAVMAAAAIGLYQVKHNAKDLAEENDRIAARIDRTRNNIAVLQAEWSNLNDPARIQSLAQRHLGLGSLDLNQIANASDIPMRAIPKAPLNKAQLEMLIEDTITTTGSTGGSR